MGQRFTAAERLVLTGGLLACAAAAATAGAGLSGRPAVAVAAAGVTTAIVALRLRQLHARRVFAAIYAVAALVLGLTIAGQGYLQLAADSSHGAAAAGIWLVIAAGLVTLAGAGGALVTSE